MHSHENWDDLRFILAVAETGSVSAAARKLGVNHATVLRRVATYEERQGIDIFDKTSRGYRVIEDRLRVITAAREVENAIQAVDRAVQGTQAPLQGTVRVTSTDSICQIVLPEIVAEVQKEAHCLQIELLSTNAHLELGRLNADIAVRPADTLAEELKGDVAAQLGFDIYAKPECADDRWIGLSGPLARAPVAKWMEDNVATENVVGTADSFMTLREFAAIGLGQAILPCVVGDADPRLDRRPGIMPDTAANIWVASHFDLYDAPRIRAVRQLLMQALSKRAAALAGVTASD